MINNGYVVSCRGRSVALEGRVSGSVLFSLLMIKYGYVLFPGKGRLCGPRGAVPGSVSFFLLMINTAVRNAGLVLARPLRGHHGCFRGYGSNMCFCFRSPNPVCPLFSLIVVSVVEFPDVCCQREFWALKVFLEPPDRVPVPGGSVSARRCKERMMRKDFLKFDWKCKHRRSKLRVCLSKMPLTTSSTQKKLLELEMELRSLRSLIDDVDKVRAKLETLRRGYSALEADEEAAPPPDTHWRHKLETQMGRHDDIEARDPIGRYDLRLQGGPTASYNGVLIWKIRDYTRRKAEGCPGKTSEPLTLTLLHVYFGYSRCVCGLPERGREWAKDATCPSSLYVMRGDTTRAAWPSDRRYQTTWMICPTEPFLTILTLLKPSETSGRRLQPDPNSSSSNGRQQEMNMPQGPPCSPYQSVLERNICVRTRRNTV
uniref:Uncharacterized protein n=1 Tax=Neogobius melanostomus TaxID=47308 RepID=A0A8C6SQ87_9GOBI